MKFLTYTKCLTEIWAIDLRALLAYSELFSYELPAVADKARNVHGKEIRGYERVGNVGVVHVEGPIIHNASPIEVYYGATSHDRIAEAFDQAAADRPSAIVVNIGSPGGTVAGSAELASHVAYHASKVPVVAHTSSLMASGAYWLASPSTRIIASPTALVGSIGAIAQPLSIARLLNSMGIDVETLRSEGASVKAAGNPLKTLTADEKASLQRTIDAAGGMFRNSVKAARPGISSEVFDGRVLYADDAKRAGLIDDVANYSDVLKSDAGKYYKPQYIPFSQCASSSPLRSEFTSDKEYAAYMRAKAAGRIPQQSAQTYIQDPTTTTSTTADLRSQFDSDADIRAEFSTFKEFEAYAKAAKSGRAPIQPKREVHVVRAGDFKP